jgi:hypothetical protein
VAHGSFGHAKAPGKSANRPAVFNQKSQVTIDRDGAHAPLILPIIGKVNGGAHA